MKNKTNIASAHSTKLLFQDIASHCEVSKRHRLFTICQKGCPPEAATSRASRTCSSAFSLTSTELLTFRRELSSDESKAAYDFFENAKVLHSFCRFEQGGHDASDGAHRVHGIGDRVSGLSRWSASFRGGEAD